MIHLTPMHLLSRYLLSACSISEIIIGIRDIVVDSGQNNDIYMLVKEEGRKQK